MSSVVISGDTSGAITLAAPAVAGSNTLTLPVGTDTLVGLAATQTLTNKTLTNPVISTIVNTGTLTLPTSSGTLLNTSNASQEIGQCRLVLSSTTAIKLNPCDGQYIKIAGTFYTIPSGGVTLTNSGLSSSTLYYIYAYVSGGNVALSASTTGYTTDSTSGNIGTPILSGNNAYTLVGMAYTNASTQFADDSGNRNLLSYFNRLDKNLFGSASNYTTTSTSVVVVSPSMVGALNWANDGICVFVGGQGGMTSNYALARALYDNSASNLFGMYQYIYGPSGSLNPPTMVGGWHQPSEGYHTYYIGLGAVSGSGTATINNTSATGYVRG